MLHYILEQTHTRTNILFIVSMRHCLNLAMKNGFVAPSVNISNIILSCCTNMHRNSKKLSYRSCWIVNGLEVTADSRWRVETLEKLSPRFRLSVALSSSNIELFEQTKIGKTTWYSIQLIFFNILNRVSDGDWCQEQSQGSSRDKQQREVKESLRGKKWRLNRRFLFCHQKGNYHIFSI